MSDEDEQFQQRWGIRGNDSDADSSSDDQSRQPTSESGPKRRKPKMATSLFPDKDDQKSMHSPQPQPTGEKHSNEGPEKEPNKSVEKPGRIARTKKLGRKAFNHDPFFDSASIDLSGDMESLVEGLEFAGGGLLKWMNDELAENSSKDNEKTSPPVVAKKAQRRGSKQGPNPNTKTRSKTPRTINPNKARRKSGTITQNPEEGSSDNLAKDSKTSQETSEVVIPANEPAENAVSGIISVERNPKQKGKRLAVQKKKQRVDAVDQQTDKAPETVPATAASASASNYLTLPTVLARHEIENRERNNSEGENAERDTRSRINLSSQLNFTLRSQQKDVIFSQNGLRNVSEYEQNTAPAGRNIWGTRGNGNGNGNGISLGNGNRFPFGLHSQGANGGIGMTNFQSQFGLPYLSQESILSGLRINNGHGHPIMPNGNHSFNESYGTFNQQLRFKAQSGNMLPR